ncbi:MAG TPA: sigma 54-interacting transcriptional regulator [bacterium]|nr:sigma 54-interacting transcriptional regulator [bacterium]
MEQRHTLGRATNADHPFRMLLDHLPTPAWACRPDGTTALLNQCWLDYTGLSLAQALAEGWHGPVHPDDRGPLRETWARLRAAGAPGEAEVRLRRGDGVYRWCLVRAVPVRDEWGHLVHWSGTATDIEDRKQAEAALQWSKALLAGEKRVLEMIATGQALSCILEAVCRVVEAQASDILSSCLVLDAHGTHLRHAAAPRLPHRYIDAIDGVAIGPTGGSCITAAYRAAPVIVADIAVDPLWAAYRHLPLAHGLRACWSAPILSSAGQVLGTFALYYREPRRPRPQDLEVLEQIAAVAAVAVQHQRAHERLRHEEQELRRIVDAIPQAIVVLGPDGRTLYANQATLAYAGLTLDEVMAADFRYARWYHPDDVARLHDERQQGLACGLPFALERRGRRHDGQYRWFLTQYNPLRDDQGRLLRWYATGTDIDERKQAEDRTRNENVALREEIVRASMFEEIVGSSAALRRVLEQVSKVAPTDSTVLILGETGTGKELIARAIHNRSKRAGRAFIRVNCAAIVPSLIASELFGHERGAFTGALQRRLGRFEAADGGTIFLDEVGDLPLETQVALLRVLQEREFERVGASHTVSVDVRVLAATNKDLSAAMAAGTFRQDLFYRLNVFPIRLPALRERVDDMPLLVGYLIDRYAQRAGKKFRHITKSTLDLFQAYDWPGNIRELQNVIERAVILCDGDTFCVDEPWLTRVAPRSRTTSVPLVANLVERERAMIETALREAEGVIGGPTGAAAKLGIPRQTLASKIRKLRINRHRFKTS